MFIDEDKIAENVIKKLKDREERTQRFERIAKQRQKLKILKNDSFKSPFDFELYANHCEKMSEEGDHLFQPQTDFVMAKALVGINHKLDTLVQLIEKHLKTK